MTAGVALCEIVLARCGCGTVFPALPGVDRTGWCRGCRVHHDRSANRTDESSPGYRLAAEIATYSAALHLIGVVGERALTADAPGRAEVLAALQEVVEVAGAAVFGQVYRDPPAALAALLPRSRTAPDVSIEGAPT